MSFSRCLFQTLRPVFLIGIVVVVSACGGGGGSASPPFVPADSFRAIVVSSGTIHAGGTDYPYQLLRLEVTGKDPSFAQWMPQPGAAQAPAVMLTDPYGHIVWNGDLPPSSLDLIRSPEDVFNDAFVYLINGFSVLNVFGRFYTEGNIQNDVDDMVAGLQYLGRHEGVMQDRIAVSGGSWGGFEALWAAARAPRSAVPRVGVALFPVSDFEDLMNYVVNDIPATIVDPDKRFQYFNFFAPYVQRINGTAQAEGYGRWTRGYLLANLQTDFLVVHDQWDTLIPFGHSWDLVAQSGGRVHGLWFFKGSEVDLNALPFGYAHGDLQAQDSLGTPFSFPVSLTLSLAYLINGIALPDQVIFNGFDPDALAAFVQYLKTYKDGGVDMEWAAPRLLDLADDRVRLINMDTANDVRFGDAETARILNEVWGTALDEDNVRSALAAGLPPY